MTPGPRPVFPPVAIVAWTHQIFNALIVRRRVVCLSAQLFKSSEASFVGYSVSEC